MSDVKFWAGAFIVFGVLMSLINQSVPKTAQQEAEARKTPDEKRWGSRENGWSAALMCEQFFSKRLKAPSTAKFQDSYDADVGNLGGGRYRVNSYVDSQNSFGAMLRTKYQCEITDVGGSKWRLGSMRTIK